MKKYKIKFDKHSYDYILGREGLSQLISYIEQAEKLIIISDLGVPDKIVYYFQNFLSDFKDTKIIRFQQGEVNKNLNTVTEICEEAIRIGADRRSCIVAIGGGVTGNVSGMVAALLFRGIDLIHIPTTLMAASDSVLSLKQAVNLSGGKNLVGTFYKPSVVYVDSEILAEQSPRDLRNGNFELIKNTLAIRPKDIAALSEILNADNKYSSNDIDLIIDYSIKAKTHAMEFDSNEKREGIVLEYGHTIGHAIELASEGRLMHGECVAFGMIVAANISNRLGFLSTEELETHYKLLNLIGYSPKDYPSIQEIDKSIEYLCNDNKKGYLPKVDGEIGIVILEKLGKIKKDEFTFITNIKFDLVIEEMRNLVISKGEKYEYSAPMAQMAYVGP